MKMHSRFAIAAAIIVGALGVSTEAADLSKADPNVGVDSKGEQYPLLGGTKGKSGSEAGNAGSGEQAEQTENAAEGARLLALPGKSGEPGIEIIIGPDNRVRVADTTTYPERANVLVVLGGGRCSGTLIGKDLVLTAGHCVHSGKNGTWETSVTVYPGRNGSSSPYGSCGWKTLYSVVGWTRDGNSNYDFGAIKLNCDVGNRTGWLGYFWQSATLVGKPARISGYPGDKPLEQWTHTDSVRGDTGLKTIYHTDTMPGNSGSGVFAQSSVPQGCNGPCVHSVHTSGDAGNQRNLGTRITRPLFENLVRWSAQ